MKFTIDYNKSSKEWHIRNNRNSLLVKLPTRQIFDFFDAYEHFFNDPKHKNTNTHTQIHD